MKWMLMARETAGTVPDDIGLLARCDTVLAKFGHRFKGVYELEDDVDAPRIAFVPTGVEV